MYWEVLEHHPQKKKSFVYGTLKMKSRRNIFNSLKRRSDCGSDFKRKALGILGSLVEKSENQTLILSIMINKLGDRSKEFASAVIHKLRLIAGTSCFLMHLIVQEIRSFLFRPNLLERSKYYSLSLLSCLELKKSSNPSGSGNIDVKSLALTMVKIYMSFFHPITNSKEIPERLTTILLSGLCRTVPFITEDAFTSMVSEINDLFRLVHTTGFTVSVQALSVLFQLSIHHVAIRDRYYQALYRKLLDPAIHQSSRNPTLLRLVYQSMIADDDTDRISAFVHRILQLCVSHTDPGFVIGCLILLNKVSTSKPNLIVASQTSGEQLPINQLSNLAKFEDSDDSDEHFSDAPCSEDDGEIVQNCAINEENVSPRKSTVTGEHISASWYHRALKKERNSNNLFGSGYNPTAREPKFAKAAGCLVWSLSLLSKHVHPTVNLFANSLLNNLPIKYSGDPFTDFATMHFLDRFAYKKPKVNKLNQLKSESGNVRKTAPGRLLQRKEAPLSGPRSISVDSSAFRQLPVTSVPAHERFFHKYFNFLEARPEYQAKKTVKQSRKLDDEDDSDTDSVPDSEFDDYLEKHEKSLFPSKEEWESDDEPEFSDNEFMDNSEDETETKEYDFSEMDNLDSSAVAKVNKLEKSADSKSVYHKFQDDNDDDEKGDEDSEEEAEEDYSDDSSDGDDDDIPDKSGKFNLNNLLASAEEVGHLYDLQQTGKEKRQQFWQEKRLNSQSGFSRKRERGDKHWNQLKQSGQSNRRPMKSKGSKLKRPRHT
ncbi:unnamed protein product [Heterobilharzia americana]|nr:unnamed protein product [Heterobilharzia americana]